MDVYHFKGIESHVGDASGPVADVHHRAFVAAEARAVRPLQRMSSIASQLVNNARAARGEGDDVPDAYRPVVGALLADMARWRDVLAVAADAADAMIADLSSQFGVEPMSEKIESKDQPALPIPGQTDIAEELTRPGAVVSGEPAHDPAVSNVGAMAAGHESKADTEAENEAMDDAGSAPGDPNARVSAQRDAAEDAMDAVLGDEDDDDEPKGKPKAKGKKGGK